MQIFVDVGGGNPYPFDVSDGTLYTSNTIITLAPGYYRIAIASSAPPVGDSTFSSHKTRVITTQTADLIIEVSGLFQNTAQPPINIYDMSLPIDPKILQNNGNASKGWTSESTLQYIFQGADDINKGVEVSANYLSSYPTARGTSSGVLVITKIIQIVNPTEVELTVSNNSSLSSSAYVLPLESTGFVWIREVEPT